MAELTKHDRAYIAAVAANTPKDFPNLVCGWPDDEYGDLDHDKYLEFCRGRMDNLIDTTPDGCDVPSNVTFPTFKGWRDASRYEDEERGDLGFAWSHCELCGALPGDRYAVTALPADPASNPDYITLRVCQDCLCWIANGDLPGGD